MPESPTTITALTTALAGLGRTSDEVANTLDDHRVTGLRNNGGGCPITRWVKRQVPHVAHLFTCLAHHGQPWLWINGEVLEGCPDGHTNIRVPLPAAVVDFIADFDRGVYPWLIEAPAVAA